MVVQKTIDNLKDKSKDEKTAIAGAFAITVVIVLLIGWGFWFFKKIQRGEEFRTFMSSAQDEFNPSGVRDAQKQLEEEWRQSQEQLRSLRDIAVPDGAAPPNPPPSGEGDEQFGTPDDTSL